MTETRAQYALADPYSCAPRSYDAHAKSYKEAEADDGSEHVVERASGRESVCSTCQVGLSPS